MSNTSRQKKQTAKQSIFQAVADMMSRDGDGEIDIRYQTARDTRHVVEIDRLCSGENAWTEEQVLQVTSRHGCVLKVAVRNGEVIGFMAYKLNADRINLVRIAVLPSAWRTRIATRLVKELKGKMERVKHLRSVRADVPDDCLGAQLLLRKNGFRATEILKWRDGEYYRMIYKKTEKEND